MQKKIGVWEKVDSFMQKNREDNNVRQSNFESLRLLCIFGIITMHTQGLFNRSATGMNLVYGVLINSIFNSCVSIFVLISGYFGINGSVKKYLKLEMEVIFYSVLSVVIVSAIQNSWNLGELIRAFLPVISGRYWYVTTYMLLFIFSKYINKIPENLNRKDFEKLLLLMFVVFSVVPTVAYFHIMNDGGKGLANMLLMYLVGRYIRLYWDEKPNCLKKSATIGIIAVFLGFALNMGVTILRGNGVSVPFARDCSSIIVIASIAGFMVFKCLSIKSKIINNMAKHVFAVYLFEGTIRTCINCIFDITVYGEKWYLFAVIAVYVVVAMAGCMLVDLVRSALAPYIENAVYSLGYKAYRQIYRRFGQNMKLFMR